MADLAAGFYPDKRPRADMRTASLKCASDAVVFMNQLLTITAGVVESWAESGVPHGLALEERAATGKLAAGQISELNNRIITDVSGPKVLVKVDGGAAAPVEGMEVGCASDNLDDCYSTIPTIKIGRIDDVVRLDTGNVHYCWVQLYPREHFGT